MLAKPVSGTSLASRICSVIDSARSFVRAADYFGPDRRRHDVPFKGMERRLIPADEIKVVKNVNTD